MNRSCRILVCLLLVFNAWMPDLFAQCTPNTLAFNGSQPIYNTACGNNSYQVINGTTPTGTGNTFRWEVSFSGGAYTTVVNGSGLPINSQDLPKSDITNYILAPAANASGDYRIRRIVTNTGAGCSNPSQPVFLYYSQSSSTTSGGTISGNLTGCSPASGTLTVSGHTGPVLRWESAPTSAGPWTPVSNTTNTLNYSGLTTGTCYRALIDNICDGNAGTIDAMDKYSTSVCITVNSVPAITVQPVSQGICVGSALNLSVTATSVLAISYQWRKNGADINGAVSASYSIPSVSNADAGSYDVVISNSCGSVTSNAAVVTVNPVPIASVPSNYIVCPGAAIPMTSFSSSPTGATFTWTNSNTAIGLAASGSGDVPSFNAVNGTTAAITATITVTPILNGCAGPPSSYTITVNPTAIVAVPGNISVCAGAIIAASNFSSTPVGATYTWTNLNTAIGLADATGTGNVPSFTAVNGGASPVSTTITVTPIVNGCAGTPSSYVITVNPLPVITSQGKTDESLCDQNDGSITITATGTAPLEYSINGGNTFQSSGYFPNLGSGSYAVVVRNASGCSIAGNILSITSPGAPAAPTIDPFINPICEGTTLVLEVTNPDGAATYNWTGPMGFTATGPSITRLAADPSMSGDYAVTATIATCVSASTIFSVTVDRRPVVTVPANLTYCAGATIPASAFISTPAGATYTWTNTHPAIGIAGSGSGQIGPFTALNSTGSPITATITVTPTLNGCAGPPVSYTITVNPLPVIVAVANVITCDGSTVPQQDFSSNISGTTFSWTVTGLGAAISGSGSILSFTAVNQGTTPIVGTVTVSPNVNGCSGTPLVYTITVNPLPRITNSPLNQTTCSGISTTEVVLTSDVAGTTFSWTATASSGDITGFTLSGTGNIPAMTISNSGTVQGTVTYTIIPTADCPGPATSYVIRVDPLPKLLPSIPLSQTVCSGNPSTAVNLSSEVAGTTFTWTATASSGLSGFQTSGTSQIPSQTIFNAGAVPGTVTYTIVPVADGCTGTTSVYTIVVNPLPTATISGTATVCYGADAVLTVALTGTAPWSITYSDGTSSFTINNITTNSYSFTVSATSTKTYAIDAVSDAICSNYGSGSATITQPASALSASASGNNVSCFGAGDGSIVFSGSAGGSGSYEYSINGGTSWQTALTFNSLVPGTYNLQVRDVANPNCTFVVNSALVLSQPAAPLAAALSSQVNVLCYGASTGSASLTVGGGTAPYSYLWSNGSASADLVNVPAGTYTVNVSDANGCAAAAPISVTITQPSGALTASASSVNVSCFGGSNGAINLASVNGGSGTYEYSINGGTSWQTGVLFANLPAGTYTVQVRDAAAISCIFTVNAALIISQPSALNATSSSSNVTCFGAADGTITISNISGGSGTYEYSINGNTWQNGNTFAGLAAGTYLVQMRDRVNPACVLSINAALTISQPQVLSGTVVLRNVSCRGAADGSITVVNSAGGYGNYEYSNNGGINWQSSPVFNNLSPGTYNVQIRDLLNTGCQQALNSTVIIREAAEPLVSGITSLVNINCFGASSGSVALFVRGGVAPYTYTWSNGAASRDLNNVPAGTYTVSITDSYNCISSQTVTINQPAAPLAISYAKSDVKCFGESNGSISLTVSGGTAPYVYRWNNGLTAKDRINLPAGVYTVTATDAKGCLVTQEIRIEQPALALGVDMIQTNVNCFGGTDGSVQLTVRGGTAPYIYNWSTGQNTSSLNGISQGNYSVTIFDANGCSLSRSVSITQPSAPLLVSMTIKNTVCRTSSDGMITAAISGGTAPYRVSWQGRPQTTPVLTGLAAGLYELTVTDAKGCIFNAPAEVIAGVCPPVAVDDSFRTYEGSPVSGTAALNDFDRDKEALTFTISAQPKNGKIVFNSDGSFTYTPTLGYWGTETIPYKICNTSGVCSTANIIIQVIPFTIVNLTPGRSNVSEGRKTTITARLEKPYKDDAIVRITYSGIAIKDRDYILLDQYLQMMIPKGKLETTQKITIAALTDDLDENDEIINVQIASTSDPEVRIGTSAVVIIGDIYPPVISDLIKDSEVLPNPDIKIEPLLSPNGDGLGNEVFIIENIVSFPDNEVLIFNRWGNEVFRIKGYNESDRVFKGYANTGLLTNTHVPLADGVYYYLITTRRTLNGTVISAVNKGYIILKR